jgi:hypothetical protein
MVSRICCLELRNAFCGHNAAAVAGSLQLQPVVVLTVFKDLSRVLDFSMISVRYEPAIGVRHEPAIEQTLSWAQQAADNGAYEEALDWLDVVDLVDRALPAEWELTRESWRALAARNGHESG